MRTPTSQLPELSAAPGQWARMGCCTAVGYLLFAAALYVGALFTHAVPLAIMGSIVLVGVPTLLYITRGRTRYTEGSAPHPRRVKRRT